MTSIEEKLIFEIEWRTNELLFLKTLPFKSDLSEDNRKIIYKYSLPAIYSIWQGFFKKIIELYLDYIDQNEILSNICLNIITSDIYKKWVPDKIQDKRKKVQLIGNILNYYNNSRLSTTIEKFCNIDFEIANDMLSSYNITNIPVRFKNNINKLAFYRHKIAHGESAPAPITQEFVNTISNDIQDVMIELSIIVLDTIKKKKYINNNIQT